MHDWAKSLDSWRSSHCLLLDFAKAFDSVPHQRLVLKLESLGIHGDLLKWLNYYLTNRFQRVLIGGHFFSQNGYLCYRTTYVNHVHAWSLMWQLTLSPSKCEALNITNKHSPVSFDYLIALSQLLGRLKLNILV